MKAMKIFNPHTKGYKIEKFLKWKNQTVDIKIKGTIYYSEYLGPEYSVNIKDVIELYNKYKYEYGLI